MDAKDTKHETEIEIFIISPQKSKLKPSRATFGQVEELHTNLTLEKDKRTILKQKYLSSLFSFSFYVLLLYIAYYIYNLIIKL